MRELLQYFNTIYPLSSDLEQYLLSIFKVKELTKKSYILKQGQVCRNLYFIEKGLVRCFYIKDDKEVCSWFMKEGDLIISVESFFKQVISYENIQAIEDCLVYYIDYKDLQYMYRHFIDSNFLARVVTEKYYMLSEQRLFSIRMQRAQERYQYLIDNFPELIQRVPSKYIASYLSITEETLSRIRGKK